MATQIRQTTPPPPVQASALKGKAGTLTANHNETLAWAPRPAGGLKVKTHIKAGSILVHD
jgi:hypothetical protein